MSTPRRRLVRPASLLTNTLCLVGCGKRKLRHAAPAKDLYCSALFHLSRKWAELHADAWAVQSARYGVVEPDKVIEPYDTTITDRSPFGRPRLTPKEIGTWLYASVQAWRSRFATATQAPALVILAGRDYWQWLIGRRVAFGTPLDGRGIGERLRWLKQHAAEAPTAEERPRRQRPTSAAHPFSTWT
jgi:hypothetical protein